MRGLIRRFGGFRPWNRYLTASGLAAIGTVLWLIPVLSAGATTTTVNGDVACGYSGTMQFTESTVMRWAQTTGAGLNGTTFEAYGNDENAVLLGVSGATADTGSPPADRSRRRGRSEHDGVALTGSEQQRPYAPSLYISPLSAGPGSWTQPGDAIPQEPGDWQHGGSPVNVSAGTGHEFVDSVFGTWVVGSQTINPSAAPGNIAMLNQALTQNTQYGPTNGTYSLMVSGWTKGNVVSGDSITLTQSGNTQTLTASGNTPAGSSSITVKAFKPGKSFTAGATVADATAQTGNYVRQSNLPSKVTGTSVRSTRPAPPDSTRTSRSEGRSPTWVTRATGSSSGGTPTSSRTIRATGSCPGSGTRSRSSSTTVIRTRVETRASSAP